jgi:hypothetical protein
MKYVFLSSEMLRIMPGCFLPPLSMKRIGSPMFKSRPLRIKPRYTSGRADRSPLSFQAVYVSDVVNYGSVFFAHLGIGTLFNDEVCHAALLSISPIAPSASANRSTDRPRIPSRTAQQGHRTTFKASLYIVPLHKF